MKLFLVLAAYLCSSFAFAQKAKILITDPDVDAESLEKDYIVQKPAQHYALPDKDKRDIFFEGISSIKNLDELEKDMLYMAIKTKSLKDLKKRYPDIPERDLKNMLRKE